MSDDPATPQKLTLTSGAGGPVLIATGLFALFLIVYFVAPALSRVKNRPPGDGSDPATYGFVLDGAWEATTVQASYFFADATQAYVSYEDVEADTGDFDDLDVGINHYYSDSCKATLEVDFEDANDDMTIMGQVQFTF